MMGWEKSYPVRNGELHWLIETDEDTLYRPSSTWNPCNDWNDAMMAANTLSGEDKLALSERLEWHFHNAFLDNLTPRKLTEFTLKAAGVDEGKEH